MKLNRKLKIFGAAVLLVLMFALVITSCAPAGYWNSTNGGGTIPHEFRLIDKDAGVVCYVVVYVCSSSGCSVSQSCIPLSQTNKYFEGGTPMIIDGGK